MDANLIELSLTWGPAALLVAVGAVGVAVLPWRAVSVRASAAAWNDLSEFSGGFARERVSALGRGVARMTEASTRRSSASLSRTLS